MRASGNAQHQAFAWVCLLDRLRLRGGLALFEPVDEPDEPSRWARAETLGLWELVPIHPASVGDASNRALTPRAGICLFA